MSIITVDIVLCCLPHSSYTSPYINEGIPIQGQDEQQYSNDHAYETIDPQELDESGLENSEYDYVVIPVRSWSSMRIRPNTEQVEELPLGLTGEVHVNTTAGSSSPVSDDLGYTLTQCPAYYIWRLASVEQLQK